MATYLVVKQSRHQGANIDIHSKHQSKKAAEKEMDKASEKSEKRFWIMSKTAFTKKYPKIARVEL